MFNKTTMCEYIVNVIDQYKLPDDDTTQLLLTRISFIDPYFDVIMWLCNEKNFNDPKYDVTFKILEDLKQRYMKEFNCPAYEFDQDLFDTLHARQIIYLALGEIKETEYEEFKFKPGITGENKFDQYR